MLNLGGFHGLSEFLVSWLRKTSRGVVWFPGGVLVTVLGVLGGVEGFRMCKYV